MNIPRSMIDKFNDGADLMFDTFAINCKLVSISKVEEVVYTPTNNVPEKNSINAHRIKNGVYERENKIIKEVETLTNIKLKVYWDIKRWSFVSNSIVVPEGSIQTIGKFSDLNRILQSKGLIVNSNISTNKELYFERMGEYIPTGFDQDKYFACIWRRA